MLVVAAAVCVLNDEQALEPIAQELMKFKRETVLEALQLATERGTKAGRAQAGKVLAALGEG